MSRISINGEMYDADEKTLAELQRDGVKYEPVGAEAESGGFWQGAGDLVRGGAHGLTAGVVDAKWGKNNTSVLQDLGLDDYKDVADRSPVLTTVGDIGGSIAGVGKLGTAAKGAGLLARMGKGALGSGVESLVRETAEQGAGADIGQSAKAGGWGALLGALIPGAGAAVKGVASTKAAQGLADFGAGVVKRGSDAARNRSAGLGVAEMKALGQKTGLHGDDLAATTAQEIEKLAPAPKWGQSASVTGDVLRAERDAQGAKIGASLDEAGQREGLNAFITDSGNGAQPGMWDNLRRRMSSDAAALPSDSGGELALSNAATGFSERLNQSAAPSTLGGVHKRISGWGDEAYAGKNAVSTLNDSASAQASEMGRSIGRDELGQYIDKYASQETAQNFNEGMKGYSRVADYAKAATNRADIESASSNDLTGNAVALAAAAGQGMTGALAGGAMGGIPGAIGGGIAGLGTGIATALHSGTNNQLKQTLGGTKGQSMLANAGRYMTPKIQAAPQTLQGMGEGLAAQGNRAGVVGTAGMIPPNYVYEDDETAARNALGYGRR